MPNSTLRDLLNRTFIIPALSFPRPTIDECDITIQYFKDREQRLIKAKLGYRKSLREKEFIYV